MRCCSARPSRSGSPALAGCLRPPTPFARDPPGSPARPAGGMTMRPSGRGEDLVASDPPPDDMHLAVPDLLAIAEGGPAIRGPGHPPEFMACHFLYPQARPEAAACREIRHEHCQRGAETSLLLRAEPLPVPVESRQAQVGGHQPAGKDARKSSSLA